MKHKDKLMSRQDQAVEGELCSASQLVPLVTRVLSIWQYPFSSFYTDTVIGILLSLLSWSTPQL